MYIPNKVEIPLAQIIKNTTLERLQRRGDFRRYIYHRIKMNTMKMLKVRVNILFEINRAKEASSRFEAEFLGKRLDER